MIHSKEIVRSSVVTEVMNASASCFFGPTRTFILLKSVAYRRSSENAFSEKAGMKLETTLASRIESIQPVARLLQSVTVDTLLPLLFPVGRRR